MRRSSAKDDFLGFCEALTKAQVETLGDASRLLPLLPKRLDKAVSEIAHRARGWPPSSPEDAKELDKWWRLNILPILKPLADASSEIQVSLEAREKIIVALTLIGAVACLAGLLQAVSFTHPHLQIVDDVTRFTVETVSDNLIRLIKHVQEFPSQSDFSSTIITLAVHSLSRILAGAGVMTHGVASSHRINVGPLASFLIYLIKPQEGSAKEAPSNDRHIALQAFDTALQNAVFAGGAWRPGVKPAMESLASTTIDLVSEDGDCTTTARRILALMTWKGVKDVSDARAMGRLTAFEWACTRLIDRMMLNMTFVERDLGSPDKVETLLEYVSSFSTTLISLCSLLTSGGNIPLTSGSGKEGGDEGEDCDRGMGGVHFAGEQTGQCLLLLETSRLSTVVESACLVTEQLLQLSITVDDKNEADGEEDKQKVSMCCRKMLEGLAEFVSSMVNLLDPSKLAMFTRLIVMVIKLVVLGTSSNDNRDPLMGMRAILFGSTSTLKMFELVALNAPGLFLARVSSSQAETPAPTSDLPSVLGPSLKRSVSIGRQLAAQVLCVLVALRSRLTSTENSDRDELAATLLIDGGTFTVASNALLLNPDQHNNVQAVVVSLGQILTHLHHSNQLCKNDTDHHEDSDLQSEILWWLWRGLESVHNSKGAAMTMKGIIGAVGASHAFALDSGKKLRSTATWLSTVRSVLLSQSGKGIQTFIRLLKSVMGFGQLDPCPFALRSTSGRDSPLLQPFLIVVSMWKDLFGSHELRSAVDPMVKFETAQLCIWMADELSRAVDWDKVDLPASQTIRELLKPGLRAFAETAAVQLSVAPDYTSTLQRPQPCVTESSLSEDFSIPHAATRSSESAAEDECSSDYSSAPSFDAYFPGEMCDTSGPSAAPSIPRHGGGEEIVYSSDEGSDEMFDDSYWLVPSAPTNVPVAPCPGETSSEHAEGEHVEVILETGESEGVPPEESSSNEQPAQEKLTIVHRPIGGHPPPE